MADPRIPAPRADGTRPSTPAYDAPTGLLKTLPNYLFWMVFLFAFSYLGANLPILLTDDNVYGQRVLTSI
jgi:hypothetical protein